MSWKFKKDIGALLAEEKNVPSGSGGQFSFALGYPNEYRFGMGNLGFLHVWQTVARHPDYRCERFFMPDRRQQSDLKKSGAPLFAWESRLPLTEFDIVAFSVSYENDYINLVRMLIMAGIKPLAAERDEQDPLIICGGFAPSLNPEPLAEICDLIFVGEAEPMLEPFLTKYAAMRLGDGSKAELLDAATEIEGIYNPRSVKKVVRARRLQLGEPINSRVITPSAEFGEMMLLEAARGCGRFCRFCAAGHSVLPPRYVEAEKIIEAVEKGEKVGLIGAGIGDHPQLKQIMSAIIEKGCDFSLSSVRLDRLDDETLSLLARSSQKTLTVAPEAGSAQIRSWLNKSITDEEITGAVEAIFKAGITGIKAYFLVGLPERGDEEIEAIAHLVRLMEEARPPGKGVRIVVSVSPFVPKPFTPLQRVRFGPVRLLEEKMRKLKSMLPNSNLRCGSAGEALIEAILCRSGREASKILLEAAHSKRWLKKVRADHPVLVGFADDVILPWQVVEGGISEQFLKKSYAAAKESGSAIICPGTWGKDVDSCTKCGVCGRISSLK
jgi:radical SAM superfamily enzyme YgiQ (UPF0313 family)